MPTTREYNQFRRLVGDYGEDTIDDGIVDSYLDDAAAELTADPGNLPNGVGPLTDFDQLPSEFRPEVITFAGINWWWNLAANLQEKHSQSLSGGMTQQVGERWERAMRMIEQLQLHYDTLQSLRPDINVEQLSYFSKASLRRVGAQREETVIDELG